MPAKKQKSKSSGVRIIAGRWRGRRIPVPERGVRPTGDRVRETLFNWLHGRVAGASCLDLFAGTGVLGLEALSRGAGRVVFVEQNQQAVRQLEQTLRTFGCDDASVIRANALAVDLAARGPFDLVFLDPPFGTADIGNLCKLLEKPGVLSSPARIYAEMAVQTELPEFAPEWQVLREGKAGRVRYALLEYAAATHDTKDGEELSA